jgi:hypothetical protein
MRDLLYTIGILFILAFSAVMGFIFLSEFEQQLPFANDAMVVANFDSAELALTQTLDIGFILITIGLTAGAMITGHMLPTRPVFFVPFMIILMLMVAMTAQVSNIWYEYTQNTTIQGYISGQFVYIPIIMENLAMYIAIIGTLVGVAVYGGIPSRS